MVHNSKLKKITVALCMALMPLAVFSAGLGKLNVNSGLGEPLNANIELLSVSPEELNSIFATIASEEAYAIQGIERPASHNTIKVELGKNANGAPILKLKSTQPISEPFLDVLIQVDWASGRLLREYTVLLDPPGYKGEPELNTQNSPVLPNQVTQLPATKSVNPLDISNTPAASLANNKSTVNSNSKPTKAVAVNDPVDLTTDVYVTKRGDSLAKIARDIKPEGISLDQMLVGLYQVNPNAFDGKNMNRLKVGKIIRPPTEQELAVLSRQQATNEVRVQSANWNEYRNRLAGIVAESDPAESQENSQSAEGKIKSAAEDKSAADNARPKDVVKLSAGDVALTKNEAKDVSSLQAKITALQEESTAREKSVQEAQDKTAALEKQILDMQQLLALKNNAMSEMQQQAELQASTASNQLQQAESALTAPVESSEITQNTADAIVANIKPALPAATENQLQQPTKPAPIIVTEPVKTSYLDGFDLPLLAAGALLLALLGGGWMYLRNKRKRNLADFEQGIMTSGGLKANTVFGNTSGSSVDTGDTSFLTDFSQSANGGMIDTNDVDPIAEAEVYMAYGRDAQAEEILKDAISKEPTRYELHLKLLEMYAASKNVSAFETIAGELYTTLGAEDPTWAKVAEIGHNLEPGNPLYIASPVHAVPHEKLDADDFSDSPMASETDLDFSLDDDSSIKSAHLNPATSITNEKDAFDLDFDTLNNQDDQFNLNADAFITDDLPTHPTINFEDTQQNKITTNDGYEFEDADTNSLTQAKLANSENQDGLDFNFSELSSAAELTESQAEANFGHTMPSLNMADDEVTQLTPELTPSFAELNTEEMIVPEQANTNSGGIEMFEFPTVDASVVGGAPLSADTNELAVEESTFNFDLTTITPEASNYVDDAADVNTYDLSSINLEMTDDIPQEPMPVLFADEPIEIETKLDLVTAYLEMGDAEGAKELLDEVMKEGGTNQRKRAEQLLTKLS